MGFETLKNGFWALKMGFEAGQGQWDLWRSRPVKPGMWV
jgi:hypothetical protein